MTTESILHTLSEAAREKSTVTIFLRTDVGEKQVEVEPYSIVEKRQQPTLFCWDLGSHRVIGLPVASLVGVAQTSHHFEPRYELEL